MGRVLALLVAGLAGLGGQSEAKHPSDVRDARSLVQRGEADGAYRQGSPRLTDRMILRGGQRPQFRAEGLREIH